MTGSDLHSRNISPAIHNKGIGDGKMKSRRLFKGLIMATTIDWVRHCPKCFTFIICVTVTRTSHGRCYYYVHFTHEKTEAQIIMVAVTVVYKMD